MPSAESINHISLISFRVDLMLAKPQEWSDEEQKRRRKDYPSNHSNNGEVVSRISINTSQEDIAAWVS